MRDSNRIDKFTEKLNDFWHRYPDYRFWQIINVLLEFTPEDKKGRDPFYWEEHTWFEMLDAAIAKDEEWKNMSKQEKDAWYEQTKKELHEKIEQEKVELEKRK